MRTRLPFSSLSPTHRPGSRLYFVPREDSSQYIVPLFFLCFIGCCQKLCCFKEEFFLVYCGHHSVVCCHFWWMQTIPEKTKSECLEVIRAFHCITSWATRHQILNIVTTAFWLRNIMIHRHVLLFHMLTAVCTMAVIPVIDGKSFTYYHVCFWC